MPGTGGWKAWTDTWGQGISTQVLIYVAITITVLCSLGSGLVYYVRENNLPSATFAILGAMVCVCFLFLVDRYINSIQEFTMAWCAFGAAGISYATTLTNREESR